MSAAGSSSMPSGSEGTVAVSPIWSPPNPGLAQAIGRSRRSPRFAHLRLGGYNGGEWMGRR